MGAADNDEFVANTQPCAVLSVLKARLARLLVRLAA
jgi:hypothetical protein